MLSLEKWGDRSVSATESFRDDRFCLTPSFLVLLSFICQDDAGTPIKGTLEKRMACASNPSTHSPSWLPSVPVGRRQEEQASPALPVVSEARLRKLLSRPLS